MLLSLLTHSRRWSKIDTVVPDALTGTRIVIVRRTLSKLQCVVFSPLDPCRDMSTSEEWNYIHLKAIGINDRWSNLSLSRSSVIDRWMRSSENTHLIYSRSHFFLALQFCLSPSLDSDHPNKQSRLMQPSTNVSFGASDTSLPLVCTRMEKSRRDTRHSIALFITCLRFEIII